jgi:peptide chain release factor subunit 1
VTVITEDDIRSLAAFRGEQAPVTTCYLDVDGRRFIRQQDVEVELEQLLRGARERPDVGTSAADDLDRIEAFVRGGFDRSGTKGLAIFSCSAHGLWRVVPLPVPVRSQVVVNHAPALGQLENVVQDLPSFGVLLVDKQRARMFVFDLGELVDRSEVFDALLRDYDSRGHHDQSGYDKDQHHVAELAHQHLRHAAAVAFQVWQESSFRFLSIGAADTVAAELQGHLHPYLRERLAPRLALPVAAGLEEIREAVLAVEAEVVRQQESRTVAQLRDTLGAGGRAVAGLEAVLVALYERRIEHLLVSDGYAESGWRCGSCGALAHLGRNCPHCGGEMTHLDDVVEEAIEDALAQGVKVTICTGDADLDVLGRIGALLRY